MIQIHACQISSVSVDGDENCFEASYGWLRKFMKRNKLSCRRPTTTCQQIPENYQEKIINFVLYVQDRIKTEKYDHIYCADETAVFLDSSNSKCVEEVGSKQVPILTTGHDKVQNIPIEYIIP
uniref:HTH CENPB-type domain-containing protein n=1 Tax=Meloidogyne javanica TaxID=6303 RepID=A0A915MSP8_MELJA